MSSLIHNAIRDIKRMARPLFSQSFFLAVPVFAVLGFGGCPKKPVKAKFVHTGVTQPPRVPMLNIDTTPPHLPAQASTMFVFPIPSPLNSAPRPPAPRRSSTSTEPEPEPTKPEAPQISPQLSDREKSQAKASAEDDIRAAQQDLEVAERHALNSTQKDIADKIRSFITQARDAMTAADWLRAKNLAQKAHVLSAELIRSF